MTVDQLRVFVEVALHLSMTRAAQILNLSQPAISAAISAIEGRYQVHLFDRVGRGLELTEAGKALLPRAQAVLEDVRQAVQALDDLAGPLRGELRVCASQTVANYWIPPHFAHFATLYPEVSLPLRVANSRETVEAVLDGTAELGFIEGQVDPSLVMTEVVGGDHMGLYAAPGHMLAGREVTPADLAGARWVVREKGSGTREHFILFLASIGLTLDRIGQRLDLPSNGAVLEAIKTGGWIAAISDLAAASRIAEGTIVRLRCEMMPRQFRMIWHRERRLGRRAEAFMTNIRARMQENMK